MDYVKVSFKKSKFVDIRVPEKDLFFDFLEDNMPKDVSPSIKEMKTELVWVKDIDSCGTFYAYILYDHTYYHTPDEIAPYTVKLSESICDLLCIPYGTLFPDWARKDSEDEEKENGK